MTLESPSTDAPPLFRLISAWVRGAMARRVLITRGGALPRESGLGRAHHDLVHRVDSGLVSGFINAGVIEHSLGGGIFSRWKRRRINHPRKVAEMVEKEAKEFPDSILHVTDQEQAHLIPQKSLISTSVTIHDLFHLKPQSLRTSTGVVQIGTRNPGPMRSRDLTHIKKGLERADILICISEATAAEARELWPRKVIAVVPHGIDVDGYDPYSYPLPKPESIDYGKVNLLYVGSEEPRKRLDFLIEVLGHLPSDVRKNVILHKVGAESSTSKRTHLNAKATSLDVEMNWIGRVSDSDLYGFYQHCDALLFPSIAEGFGLPPLEAMASGCPIRSANCPAHNEVCPVEWLIDYDDLDAWVDSIVEIAGESMNRGRRQPCNIALSHSRNFNLKHWSTRIAEAWSNLLK